MSQTKFQFPPLYEVAYVVKSVDKTVEYYQSMGMGPLGTKVLEMDSVYKGKKGKCKIKIGYLQGTVNLVLMEVLEGETPFGEFLKKRGEGLQHLGFVVKDMNEALAALAKAGVKPSLTTTMPGRAELAYMDTTKIGGAMFELCQPLITIPQPKA